MVGGGLAAIGEVTLKKMKKSSWRDKQGGKHKKDSLVAESET